jgi:hypothetical protein
VGIKGLLSINSKLALDCIARLKICGQVAGYCGRAGERVMSKFSTQDLPLVGEAVSKALDHLDACLQ